MGIVGHADPGWQVAVEVVVGLVVAAGTLAAAFFAGEAAKAAAASAKASRELIDHERAKARVLEIDWRLADLDETRRLLLDARTNVAVTSLQAASIENALVYHSKLHSPEEGRALTEALMTRGASRALIGVALERIGLAVEQLTNERGAALVTQP